MNPIELYHYLLMHFHEWHAGYYYEKFKHHEYKTSNHRQMVAMDRW
jgi:hypothetical protein